MTPTIFIRRAVDHDAASDHLPIAAEQLAPSRVAQHHHRPAGKPLVVSGQQRPPERGLDSQHLKEVAGDEVRSRETALDARQGQADHREGISEDAGLAAHRVVVGPREHDRRLVVGSYPLLQRPRQTARRAPHGIGAKKQDVVDREDHGDEPEAERDRRDDGEGGERRAAERAERVRDVACQVVDETGAARVAALVGGQRHRAEACERPGASVDGAQTGGDVLLRLALDVERELIVELALDALRSRPARESAGTGRGGSCAHASFITRPMAVDMRSHSLASTVSCRRPDAVSW